MKTSHMQHQREQDDAAEIDYLAEEIEQEMREELLDGGYYTLEYRESGRVQTIIYDRDNVVDEMIFLDSETFNQAVMMSAKDPIEAAKIQCDLMRRAVEQILGVAKIAEDAEYRVEISRRDAA